MTDREEFEEFVRDLQPDEVWASFRRDEFDAYFYPGMEELWNRWLARSTTKQGEAAEVGVIRSLGAALRKLSFCAQITGGTVGPDAGLQEAIAGAERALSFAGIAQAMASPAQSTEQSRSKQLAAAGFDARWTCPHCGKSILRSMMHKHSDDCAPSPSVEPAPRDNEFERGYLAAMKQAKEQAEIAAACVYAEQPAPPLQQVEPGWMDIETAPKDGSYFLAANQWGVWFCHYQPKATSGYVFDDPWRSVMLNHWHIADKAVQYHAATHWAPLPAAPEEPKP